MRVLHAINVFRDPEQRIEIAQSPLALLHVGLDQIARRSCASNALLALDELGGDEFGRGLGDDLPVEAGLKRLEEHSVAGDETRLDERGADCHVGASLPEALLDCAGCVAELLLDVPQHVKQRLHHLLDAGRRLVGQEEQKIDVRTRRQHPSAVSADRDNGRRRLAALRRREPAHRHVENDAQEVVDLGAQRFRAGATRSAGFERLARFVPPFGQRRLQRRDCRSTERAGVAGMSLVQRRQLLEKSGAIESPVRRRRSTRGAGAAFSHGGVGD